MSRARALTATLAGVAIAFAAVAAWVVAFLVSPQGHESRGESVSVTVPSGSSAARVGALLDAEGVVRPGWLFSTVLRVTGGHRELKAGDYEFEMPIAPRDVMRALREGRLATVAITIPEGLTLIETAEAVAGSDIASLHELVAAFSDPSPIADLDASADDLEGYLFPETYRFAKGVDPRNIATSMVDEFRSRFYEAERDRIETAGRSLRELVSLASLVEKETSVDEERARIAGVFAERLERGMRLQCDPTVIYAKKKAGRWDGNIRRADLSWDHPYNTYVRPGLPPGPIASPGLASLVSTLEPARDGSIFFVATGEGDGRHTFSKTLSEHNRNVREYLRKLSR